MPGITGIIGQRVAIAGSDTVNHMVDVMRHEPFYKTGVFRDESTYVAAGWVVHEGAFADCNPIWNDTRDICLLLAGEEFSDPSGMAPLRGSSHRFGQDDARYLVHWYEAQGDEFVNELNGTFSGLIVDLRSNTVVLFNDRYGLSRIYVHEGSDGVYFSSEAKSILRAVASTRNIDEAGLAEFVVCGCALQGRTLFKGVSLLPPASRWTFSHGRLIRKESYFRKEAWEQLPPLSEAEYYEQLKEIFPRIVRKYFRGRSQVGMSLTGGLDGRMIMACSGHEHGELPCYTFGGTYRDCTDVAIARRVARDCGQSHQVITVDDGFVRQFERLAEKSVFVSDGAMDVTGSVELFANSRAREIAPVRMTGNYGSEILRSNVAFKPAPLAPGLFSEDFVRAGRTAAATYGQEAHGRRLSLIAMKQVPWHHHSRLAVEQSQVTMRSPYLDNELVRLAYQVPAGQELSKMPALRFISEGAHDLGRIPTDRGQLYRPAPGLSSLRNAYQEFLFRAEYVYDYGMPNWLARIDKMLKPVRPERLFLGRHKFYHFRVWYRDRLSTYLQDVLLDPKTSTRPHLAPLRLRSLLSEHLRGTHNHTTALHQALSIELVYRQFIERKW